MRVCVRYFCLREMSRNTGGRALGAFHCLCGYFAVNTVLQTNLTHPSIASISTE